MTRRTEMQTPRLAIAGLEARVSAIAAAVLRAGAHEVAGEAADVLPDDTVVDVETSETRAVVTVIGRDAVLREFGGPGRPPEPWSEQAVRTAFARLSLKEIR